MENLNLLNKEAWNAYQEDYFKFNLMERPDYFEFFSNGGVDLDDFIPPMLGDVKGLKLLDTCCACDASQAFSWHNLGAVVTACDITEKAIEIASKNAAKMNFAIEFVVADMQTLEPIKDGQYDIVFATYPVWVQNIDEACRTWHRILKPGGMLLWHMEHPITYCIAEDKNGLKIIDNYNAPNTEMFDSFNGTPLARRYVGKWSVDLPTAEHFWRISDILNAVCDAGFKITNVHESTVTNPTDMNLDYQPKDITDEIEMRKLPSEFTVLAVK
jgi:ubiquinone/menaquinone biosynthesis C-methylase UbiE